MFRKTMNLWSFCCKSWCKCLKKKIWAVGKKENVLTSSNKERKHAVSWKVGSSNSLLPTFCPSWTSFRVINYPLKYTVEVLSAGMRPGEKGKLRDPATYKLLTPGLSPGRLPESSQKSQSQTSHLDFVSVTFTRAITPGVRYSPSFQWGGTEGETGERWERLRMDSLGE